MFRVRKINRSKQESSTSGVERRARMREFLLASKRLKRRHPMPQSAGYIYARTFVRAVSPGRKALRLFDLLRLNRAFALALPLSEHSAMPSMAEAIRLIVATKLQKTLHARAVGPTVIVLWPGIPGELDVTPRFTLSREGDPQSTLFTRTSQEEDVERIIDALAPTDFTPWLKDLLEGAWHESAAIWKARLLTTLLPKGEKIALPPDLSDPSVASSIPTTPRSLYRARLARLLEHVPVLSIVHPSEGETVPIDLQIADAFAGEVIPFAANNVTLIEGKVERWLTKYGIEPEYLLSESPQLTRVVNNLIPADPTASIDRTRENLLGRLFGLGHQLDLAGYEKRSTKTIDRLANQLDAQLDQLKHSARKIERRERELAFNQLTKARSYLVPGNMPQSDAMGLVHYLNFYGPDFVRQLMESIEVGDGRHHLLFVGG